MRISGDGGDAGVSNEGPARRHEAEAAEVPWQARARALRGEYEHLVGDEAMIEREIEVPCTRDGCCIVGGGMGVCATM